jgi:hypothetical protein
VLIELISGLLMGQLITLITNFLNLSKLAAVTAPGIITALGLALLAWPPAPLDRIVTATFDGTLTPPFTPTVIANFQHTGNAACTLAPVTLPTPSDPSQIKDYAKGNQDKLEAGKQLMNQCIEFENAAKGREDSENAQTNVDIATRTKELTDQQANRLNYEKTNNKELADAFRNKESGAQAAIQVLRDKILVREQAIRERARRIAEYTGELGIVNDRLADPGRLRPQKSFDDYLVGLSNHAIALALLAIAISILITPFTRSLLGGLYDTIFEV